MGQAAGWATEPVGLEVLEKRDTSCPSGIQILHRPVCRLVGVTDTLSRLTINKTDPYQIVLSHAKHGEHIAVAVERLLAS
jgi:hypothetical protein